MSFAKGMLTSSAADYHDSPNSLEARHRALVNRVITMVQDCLAEPWTLERAAEEVGVSGSLLAHIFPEIVGEGFGALLRRLRRERAAYLLQFTSLPVLTIALRCGYESQAAFSRAFHRYYECSPRQFRKQRPAYRGLESPPGNVTLRDAGNLTVAFARCREPLGGDLSEAWRKILGWSRWFALLDENTQFFEVTSEDPECADGRAPFLDCAISIPSTFEGHGDIGVRHMQLGQVAEVQVEASLAEHRQVARWLAQDWLPQMPLEWSRPWRLTRLDLPTQECPHFEDLQSRARDALRGQVILPVAVPAA